MSRRAALVLLFLVSCGDSSSPASGSRDGGRDAGTGAGDVPLTGDARNADTTVSPRLDSAAADAAAHMDARPADSAVHMDARPADSAAHTDARPADSATHTDARPADSAPAAPDSGAACPGSNPAHACRTSPDSCVPSSCSCGNGLWLCTADCGGGRLCADAGADAPAATVWPADSRTLFAWERGGYVIAPGVGSDCSPFTDGSRYTLTVADRSYDWQRCQLMAGGGAVYRRSQGTRLLADAEMARVTTALGQLRIVTEAPCGADKPVLTLTVTTPAGDREYHDSFYICQDRTKTYVSGIDAVFSVLRDLAR